MCISKKLFCFQKVIFTMLKNRLSPYYLTLYPMVGMYGCQEFRDQRYVLFLIMVILEGVGQGSSQVSKDSNFKIEITKAML